jgi:hypothetical protein
MRDHTTIKKKKSEIELIKKANEGRLNCKKRKREKIEQITKENEGPYNC